MIDNELDEQADQVNTVFQNHRTHCGEQSNEDAAHDQQSFGIRVLFHDGFMNLLCLVRTIEITDFF